MVVITKTALDTYFDALQVIALRLFAIFKTESWRRENIDNMTINGA